MDISELTVSLIPIVYTIISSHEVLHTGLPLTYWKGAKYGCESEDKINALSALFILSGHGNLGMSSLALPDILTYSHVQLGPQFLGISPIWWYDMQKHSVMAYGSLKTVSTWCGLGDLPSYTSLSLWPALSQHTSVGRSVWWSISYANCNIRLNQRLLCWTWCNPSWICILHWCETEYLGWWRLARVCFHWLRLGMNEYLTLFVAIAPGMSSLCVPQKV